MLARQWLHCKPGDAEVEVTPPGGFKWALIFDGGMGSAGGGGKIRAAKSGDTWSVVVNDHEHYRVRRR